MSLYHKTSSTDRSRPPMQWPICGSNVPALATLLRSPSTPPTPPARHAVERQHDGHGGRLVGTARASAPQSGQDQCITQAADRCGKFSGRIGVGGKVMSNEQMYLPLDSGWIEQIDVTLKWRSNRGEPSTMQFFFIYSCLFGYTKNLVQLISLGF